MTEPYAILHGVRRGETKAERHRLPIILNEMTDSYEILGSAMIRAMTIEMFWPTQAQDLLALKKRILQKEKDRVKERADNNARNAVWYVCQKYSE